MIDDVAWVESLSPEALKRLAERMGEIVPRSEDQPNKIRTKPAKGNP